MKKTTQNTGRQVTIVCALDLNASKGTNHREMFSNGEKQREMVKRISQLNKVIHQQKANCFLDVTM